MQLPARVIGTHVAAAEGPNFVPRFWAGVNIGSTVPGTQPGEVAADRDTYDRWFSGIAALGANVVRIYTILKPEFYDAVRAHNLAHPEKPIYVIQGIWIPEDRWYETQDAYDSQVIDQFHKEIRDVVNVIHGDAEIAPVRGHASGTYVSDISRWVLAWSVGVEWDPYAVQSTDLKHPGMRPFRGKYIQSNGLATPMESWIASMLDYTASREAARGWSRPISFTNWVTVDPLRHKDEPLDQEDLVSVDAEHIHSTAAWPAGMFVGYHAYPYYPDFLRLQRSYQSYRRKRDGKLDAYAGYIHELRAHHKGRAIMVTEFGAPSSFGSAHFGPNGRDQGGHSEKEAAQIDIDLMRDLQDEGFAGGVLFEWIDEWFKFTWNTFDYELPHDRRGKWRNPLTNEEHFGVIAAEPGIQDRVVLDGNDSEWQDNDSRAIGQADRGIVREVRATHDEGYLYLRLLLSRPGPLRKPITIGLDVRPEGNRGLPGMPGVDPQADVAVTLGPGKNGPIARMMQAAWTDPIRFQFGVARTYVPVHLNDLRPNSGAWVRPRQILNRPYYIPYRNLTHPVEVIDISQLPWGSGDARSTSFDDRNMVDASGRVIELRLPWSMMGFADPSTHQVVVPRFDGEIETETTDRIGIAVASGSAQLLTTDGYTWSGWEDVKWHERRKNGWSIFVKAFPTFTKAITPTKRQPDAVTKIGKRTAP